MKKKICLDIRLCQKSSRYTGIGIYAYHLSQMMYKLDTNFDIYFLVLFGKELPWKIPTEKLILVNRLSKPQAFQEFFDLIDLKFKLRKKGIQIFHSMAPGIILPNKNLKVIVTIHDIIPDLFPNELSNSIIARITYYVKMRYAIKADYIITNSNSTKLDLINKYGLNKNKIKSIYLGSQFDDNMFLNLNYPIPNHGNKFLLYLGGFTFRKNLEIVIKSFQAISNKFSDIDLLIIGKPSKEQKHNFNLLINKLKLNQNKIKWEGFVEDVNLPFYYMNCEAFIYPSLYEGFGMPLLEAMQFGAPIITSNRGAIPEILGNTSIKVNPESFNEISEAVTNILTNKNHQVELKESGKIRSKNFSWTKCALETIEVYKNI
jgi:glycosyltransferase involved in cell wall biosynthesis